MLQDRSTLRALISLGGNQGNVKETFVKALKRLAESPDVQLIEISQYYSTTPVGAEAGEQFVNAAATLETSLAPGQLLDLLQQIEAESGRVRTIHWGPRTLDLDIILWDEEIINTNRLTVPHPACFYRQFVLQPAVEIAADWLHPLAEQTLEELNMKLHERPLLVGTTCLGSSLALLQQSFADSEEIQLIQTNLQSAAIVFTDYPDSQLPKSISLMNKESRLAFVQQVLVAALDCPVAISPKPIITSNDNE